MKVEQMMEEQPAMAQQIGLAQIKYERLKSKGLTAVNLSRNYRPLNRDEFRELKGQLLEMANRKAQIVPQIDKFRSIILGSLEGTLSHIDPKQILKEKIGDGMENLKIDEYIKDKMKISSYGNASNKQQTSIREIKDLKILKSIGEIYDIKEINNHRKFCGNFRSLMKSMKKFMDTIENSGNDSANLQQIYQSYLDFSKEQIIFNKSLANISIPQIINAQKQEKGQMEDENSKNELNEVKEIIDQVTPLKEKKQRNRKKKENTASTEKLSEENKDKEQNHNLVRKTKKEKEKQKEEEMQRAKQERQRERQAKKIQKQKKKQRMKEQKQRERLGKQAQKQKERQAKQRAKQKQKERERQAKQREKEAKQAERKAKQLQKEKKINPGRSLFDFFIKPKINGETDNSPRKVQEKIPTQDIQMIQQSGKDSQTDNFLKTVQLRAVRIEDLREQYSCKKMRDENCYFEPFYTNIFTHKSRLQFTNYFVTEEKFQNYSSPHLEVEDGKYDDSSIEYEDLCGDVCNDEEEVISQEEQNESGNNTIVPDGYLSRDEISSVEESNENIEVDISKGGEWSFSTKNMTEWANNYAMVCMYDDQLPLALSDSAQESKQLGLNLKCDLYKQIHGFYGSKDILIKKLGNIADKTPKSYLDTMIRETTTKNNNQRLVKPQIIQFLNEHKEGFAEQLNLIKLGRDQEVLFNAKERLSEKERELQKTILDYEGSYYIIDLLKYLKEKGFRLKKRDLKTFIDSRFGEKWEKIKKEFNKIQLKNRPLNLVPKNKDNNMKQQ